LTCIVILFLGFPCVTVKIIILSYLVNWSKELREGDGKNAYKWNGILLFLLTCFGYYFLGVFLHGFAPHGCLGRCQR
jgi:hypothetical protein